MANEMKARPTGEITLVIGWLFLAGSCVLFFAGWATGTQAYGVDYLHAAVGHSEPAALPLGHVSRSFEQKMWLAAAAAAFSLYLVFWSVGTIVRAISFLPARETGDSL